MSLKFDATVVYRIYPRVSKVPPVYRDDKYKLSELCLKSFKDSLGGARIKLYVILDGCPPEYKALFENHFGDNEGLEFIELPGIGNNGTFKRQMDILLGQNFSDIAYFAEDDYFYLPGTFPEMISLIRDRGADFVTPFDHLDYYDLQLHDYKSERIKTEQREWKDVSTTTMTFMAKQSALRKNKTVFFSYSKGNDDASLWLSITKKRLFNPLLYLETALANRFIFKMLAKTWIYNWQKALFGKKMKLWAPEPSISTHMDNDRLAPGYDWIKTFGIQNH